MKKNLFLTFCFSFIPGAGQMYQGYMKRGLSLMTAFAVVVAFCAIISSPIFAMPLPIIFAYSFFDTYQLRQKIIDNKNQEDEYIWKDSNIDKILDIGNKHKSNKFLGIVLIVIGLYLFLNSVLLPIAYKYDLEILYTIFSLVLRYIPSVLIASLSIYTGIKLMSKNK